LNLLLNPPAAVQLWLAKLKTGLLIVKKVASVTWEQIRAIAEDKMPDLNAFTLESAMSMVGNS
jgi:large subunit ribosomal protein L11